MARMTLASIRAELDTLARHYGCTITIERTDKDGNASASGRYVTAFLPSGVSFTGVICATLAEARDGIRQYLAQTGIVPSSDTFPTDNLVAAIAAAAVSPVNTDLAILRVKYDEMCATWARHGVTPARQDVAELIGNLHSRGIVSDATLHNRETIARDLMTSKAPDPEPPAPTYPRTVSTDTAHLVNVLKAHGFTLAPASTNLIDQMTKRDADTRWMNTAGDLVVISPSRNRLDIGRHDATWGDLSTLIYIDGHITSVTFFDQNTQAGDLAYLFATNPTPPAPTLATEPRYTVGQSVFYTTYLGTHPAVIAAYTERKGLPTIIKIDVTAYGETFRIETTRNNIRPIDPEPPAPAADDTDNEPEPYEPGVFGGAHPGDDEDMPAGFASMDAYIESLTPEDRAYRHQLSDARIDAYKTAYHHESCSGTKNPMLEYAAASTRVSLAMFDAEHGYPWPEPPAPADPSATIPAISGGSHEADTTPEPEYIVSLTSGNEVSLVTRNGGVIHWKHLSDAIQSARNLMHTDNGRAYTGYAVIEMPANATVAQWSVNDSYADLPPIGGGSHEAATQPTKPRNVATSQKRDNQRAERAAINDRYHAHAEQHAPDVAAILADFGFTIISEKLSGETPVTIWQDTNPATHPTVEAEHIAHATIKQTPYSLRIYNGQPARLPRHGDAELINRVEHGWCACGEARGYAAGLADAILRLIEVPDPYMQALDAMEAREAEQSAPLPRPSAADLAEMYGSVDLDLTARLLQAGERDAYTIAAPGHDGRPVIIAEVEHHEIPNPVLIGGQPSMSGPWELPAISGGSQDAEEPEHIRFSFNASRINETLEKIGRPDLKLDVPALTADDYCVRCGQPATRWVEHHANWYAECDDCAKLPTVEPRDKDACQHDADTPAARFCSQCGHDRTPNAPQPTDTGTSHDVLPLTQKYTRKALEKKCAEASAILGKHVEVVQEPVSKRYAVTEDLPERMRNNPGDWLRERDCNTIRYWIEHLDASIRKHRACISATDFGYQLVGDEMTDMFPWAVVALPSGQIIQRYSHRAVADQVADRMRMERTA